MSQKPQVMILLEILRRYDLILIQEIVDKSGKAINQLLDQLRKATGEKYQMTGVVHAPNNCLLCVLLIGVVDVCGR